MLKGLALTPPVIGRISIGRVVEKNGKRLPEKDDPDGHPNSPAYGHLKLPHLN